MALFFRRMRSPPPVSRDPAIGDPERAIREVRDWLRLTSKRTTLPGGAEIIQRYRSFRHDLPDFCTALGLEPDRLTFLDLSTIIIDWLRTDR